MMQPLLSKRLFITAIKSLFIFTVSIFMVFCAGAQQNFVISNAGQTGTSGTNWSVSGTNPVTITATGTAAVNTSVINGYLNAGTSVILNDLSVGTTINSDISKTAGADATLTVKDLGNVKVGTGVTIGSTSNKLDIILWADDDNNQGGTVDDFMYISAGVTLSSNGGKIVLAGGPDNGSNGGTSGDGIPDGFPWNGSNSATYGGNTIGGLTLGPLGGTGTVITMSSNGGDILLRGSTSNNNNYPGITSQGNLKIDAGAGRVTIYGKSTSGHGVELTYGASPTIAINSSSLGSPAIDIKGTSTAVGYAGFFASNNASGNILIQSTAASGGGISIEGTNSTGYGILLAVSGSSIITQLLSQSGTIAIKSKGTTNTSLNIYGDSYIGNRKDATPVQGITPLVTASASNLLLQGDDQWNFSNTAAKNTTISTSGSLNMEAYSGGYTGLVSWIGNAIFGTSFSSITLGESAENYSFTLNNSLTATGNITAYTSDFILANGVGLASSGAGTIAINANGSFGTAGTTRRTISTVNGTINIFADADASGGGQLDIDYLTLNPGTGNTTVRCETMNWITTLNTDKPYFNGTGTVTIEPSDGSFQDVYTQWFYFDQDANGIAGLTIGKLTNTGNVIHQTNPLTIAGPIRFYGGYVQLDVNLTSTANGDLFFKANTNRNNAPSIVNIASILKTAGSGTLTMQGAARVNSGTITASGTGILNVVLWSDYGNNNNGGVDVEAITTNGGHLWAGGSNSAGGTYTWKGLTVGDGPSVGSVNNNYNAIDFFGSVNTGGGDVLIWAGSGYSTGISGIAIMTTGRSISSGAGNITLITDAVSVNDITLTSTGLLSLVPDGGSYPSAISWNGSLSAGNLNVSGTYDALLINNFASLGGLSIGYYNGQLLSGTPVIQANSSDITASAAVSIAGPITFYGNNLILNQNLATTGSNISLFGNSLSIGGSAVFSSTGNLVIAPVTAGTTIGLSGTGSLSLSATNFSTNFADGFTEIRIGNSTAGAITLGGVITVRDNWMLNTAGSLLLNETLDINSNNLRFIGTGITPAASKFIKTNGTGKLIMDIANSSSKLFPLGISQYNPLTITNHIGTVDTFYATVSNNVYLNGSTSGSAVPWYPRVNLTWNISNAGASTGAGNVDLLFGWNAANETGVFTVPRLLNYATSTWHLLPSTPASDLVARTLTYTGYSGNFSSFAISENNILLPVTWLLFTGKKSGNSVQLNWATAAETNNDHFDVERSADGTAFSIIGEVKAYVSSAGGRQDYIFTDNEPLSSRSFYRIRQVDIDGKFSYSKIVTIEVATTANYKITNTAGSGQLLVTVPQNIPGHLILNIFDAAGRLLLQQQVTPGQTIINTGNLLSGGVYVVNLRQEGKVVYTTRVVK